MTLNPSNADSLVETLFNKGVSHYESGELDQALEIFHALSKKDPLHFDAQYLKALTLLKSQRLLEAIDALRASLSIKPQHTPSLHCLALALTKLGQFEQALEPARLLIELSPASVDSYSLLAQIQVGMGELTPALETWSKLGQLEPKSEHIQNNIGVICHQLGQFDRAIVHYQQARLLNPLDAKTCFNLAVSQEALHDLDAALQSYQLAISIDPQNLGAHFNLGLLHIQLQKLEGAIECFDRVLSLDASMSMAYVNKAVALQKLKAFAPAQLALERAMQLEPQNALICFNLATVLQDARQLEASSKMYQRVLDLDAQHLNAWCNLGDVLHDLQQPKLAIDCYLKALSLEPQSIRAKYHLSLSYLLDAQFDKGWSLFQCRLQYETTYLSIQAQLSKPQSPLWLGQESLHKQSILVMCEQGLGDSIQFVRYLVFLRELGARVLLQVPKELVELLKSAPGVSEIYASHQAGPQSDFHVPMMSLPLALKETVKHIPAGLGYLKANPSKSQSWRDKLGPKNKLRVGLVWSGGFRSEQSWSWEVNLRRNVPLQLLKPLAHPLIEFFSLQKGEASKQELLSLKSQDWGGPEIVDHMHEVGDFSDTAAFLEQMDLLISVDTSCAHLAGALGKPVWLLNRFDTCWRWQLVKTDSPWYDSMKIYRQDRLDDWSGVLARVKTDLHALV